MICEQPVAASAQASAVPTTFRLLAGALRDDAGPPIRVHPWFGQACWIWRAMKFFRGSVPRILPWQPTVHKRLPVGGGRSGNIPGGNAAIRTSAQPGARRRVHVVGLDHRWACIVEAVSDIADAFASLDIVAELGRGGMADVYLTALPGPKGFRKIVVVKKIRASLQNDPELETLFHAEARLAARMDHPNVVQTLAFGRDADRYSIVMEFLDGKSLQEVRARAHGLGGMPVEMELEILVQVLAGLHYAHGLCDYGGTPLGIVHRDVSPSNVIVTYAGVAKLVDFGVAKVLAGVQLSEPGRTRGKVTYMAPEQARGEAVDARADIFAAGILLWESLAGKRLWSGLSEGAILSRLNFGEIPSPKTVRPELDERLEEVCMTALAFRPEHRFPTAAAFGAALEAVLDLRGKRIAPARIGTYLAELFRVDRDALHDTLATYERRHGDSQAPLAVSLASGAKLDSDAHGQPQPASAKDQRSERPRETHRDRIRRAITALSAAVVVASLTGVAWFSLREQSSPVSTSALSSHPPPVHSVMPPSPAPSSIAQDQVRLKLRALPGHARISVDGAPTPSNPFDLVVTRDLSEHEIRAQAHGYRDARATVTFAHDRDVVLTLQPIISTSATRASASFPESNTKAPADPPATSPTGTVRFEDPWTP